MRRLRDLLQGFAGGFPLARKREITERYDADEPLLPVDDGQAANLLIAHVLQHGLDAVVDEAIENSRRHRIACGRGPNVAALGDDADSSSTTGVAPRSPSRILRAISRIGVSGRTKLTSAVMTS